MNTLLRSLLLLTLAHAAVQAAEIRLPPGIASPSTLKSVPITAASPSLFTVHTATMNTITLACDAMAS